MDGAGQRVEEVAFAADGVGTSGARRHAGERDREQKKERERGIKNGRDKNVISPLFFLLNQL